MKKSMKRSLAVFLAAVVLFATVLASPAKSVIADELSEENVVTEEVVKTEETVEEEKPEAVVEVKEETKEEKVEEAVEVKEEAEEEVKEAAEETKEEAKVAETGEEAKKANKIEEPGKAEKQDEEKTEPVKEEAPVMLKAALSATAPEKTITIHFSKIWTGTEGLPSALSITLYKYSGEFDTSEDKTVVEGPVNITADDNWEYDFEVPESAVKDDSGNLYKFKVVEEVVGNFKQTTVEDPSVEVKPMMTPTAYGWTPVHPSDVVITMFDMYRLTVKDLDHAIITFKKGYDTFVWTHNELTSEEKEIVAKSLITIPQISTPRFIYGYGTHGVVTFDRITNTVILPHSGMSFYFYQDYEASKLVANPGKITNDNATKSITITKVWDDEDDQDGLRTTVQVKINKTVAGITSEVETVDLADDSDWTITKTVPVYENGEEIAYTVEEITEITDYEMSDPVEKDGTFTITNTHIPYTRLFSVEKSWTNEEGMTGSRPESIKVNLLADGETVQTLELTEASGWKGDFEEVAKCTAGKEIEYTVTEDAVQDYSSTIVGPVSEDEGKTNLVTITNEYTGPKESPDVPEFKVEKVITNQPEDGEAYKDGETITYKITVTNVSNAEALNVVVKDDLTGDEWTIDSLPAGESKSYDAKYTVTEEDAEAGTVTNVATAKGENIDHEKSEEAKGDVVAKTAADDDNDDDEKESKDNKSNKSKGVKTGDDSNMFMWILLCMASFVLVAFAAVKELKRRNIK